MRADLPRNALDTVGVLLRRSSDICAYYLCQQPDGSLIALATLSVMDAGCVVPLAMRCAAACMFTGSRFCTLAALAYQLAGWNHGQQEHQVPDAEAIAVLSLSTTAAGSLVGLQIIRKHVTLIMSCALVATVVHQQYWHRTLQFR